MATAHNSADLKLFSDLTKSDQAKTFFSNSEKIDLLKIELKRLESENLILESLLLPKIGLQYKPVGEKFILQPKLNKGRAGLSWSKVLSEAPKTCKFSSQQTETFADLQKFHTSTPVDKTTIQIVK